MEKSLAHAEKMRDACKLHAQEKIEIYRYFDNSDRAKEVMESAMERFAYWLKEVQKLEKQPNPNRLKDTLHEDRCPCHDGEPLESPLDYYRLNENLN